MTAINGTQKKLKTHREQIIRQSNYHDPECRLLIYFDGKNDRIDSINGYNVDLYAQRDLLKEKGDFCFDVVYYRGLGRLKIIRHIKGTLTIYNEEFWCTPPREAGDSIKIDYKGIKANIYSKMGP